MRARVRNAYRLAIFKPTVRLLTLVDYFCRESLAIRFDQWKRTKTRSAIYFFSHPPSLNRTHQDEYAKRGSLRVDAFSKSLGKIRAMAINEIGAEHDRIHIGS